MVLLPDICDNFSLQPLLIAYLYRCVHAPVIFVRVLVNTAFTYCFTLILSRSFRSYPRSFAIWQGVHDCKAATPSTRQSPKALIQQSTISKVFQHLLFFFHIHVSHATGKTYTDNTCLYSRSQGRGSKSRREASGANGSERQPCPAYLREHGYDQSEL